MNDSNTRENVASTPGWPGHGVEAKILLNSYNLIKRMRKQCVPGIPSSLVDQTHSYQVSRNDRDSPGIFAFVPVVSRLTQKADNVLDFSQTLST